MESSQTTIKRRGESGKLSDEQKARIERNRQRALLIRQKKQLKLSTNELNKRANDELKVGKDSGGGFLIETHDDAEFDFPNVASNNGPFKCDECNAEFGNSILKQHFDVNVCYKCAQCDPKYSLITRTDAKNEYLLKDCDLDLREPKLRYIVKKNPNPMAKGDMRLYLREEIEERALQVWESEEQLEEERIRRLQRRHLRKEKQYEKQMKELRMSVRSSLFKKKSSAHEHEFGEEIYNEEEDTYEKICKTCNHRISYEKM
ncbi:DNA repair protein complementing XP-A cells-like protein [Dinothrombium tinctorium]|uniref:DNA repair protein complementing XP-A cells-like protein n=1 Tax=Dinothrombium tinctorium TaxID=1965070 RepID=A0A3S3PPL2_9ACAR|nr:DNA repair protein complementing XP-A cells-like protein [Dinothrombium tinctorium]RWS13935.1 DNA repair protein complementing XP-A cells-like protein [Dinothrombium tinctorium]